YLTYNKSSEKLIKSFPSLIYSTNFSPFDLDHLLKLNKINSKTIAVVMMPSIEFSVNPVAKKPHAAAKAIIRAYGSCVLIGSIWSAAAPVDAIMLVSDIGEQ